MGLLFLKAVVCFVESIFTILCVCIIVIMYVPWKSPTIKKGWFLLDDDKPLVKKRWFVGSTDEKHILHG